ncbi:MAG: hypothetical protein KatS3mg105_3708 [Gemmatales bacterium]|nr:MAG: hypothetical protein KatS3mg105_3708 [Gemmatales bacterium]
MADSPQNRQSCEWRSAFPIELPQEQAVARRDFMKFLSLTSLMLVAGQLWLIAKSWLRRPGEQKQKAIASLRPGVGDLPFLPIGKALPFSYPEEHDRCLVVRLSEKDVVAYDQRCTHLSCAVVPKPTGFHCPCHHACFDLAQGRPISGPPRRPLPKIQLEIREGVIYAVGVELRNT